jgi:ATP/maltotriose-dependent transcriptional regulator MalT/DNA-binding SARP family transcriptional activator
MPASRNEFRHTITPPAFDRQNIHRAQLVDRIHGGVGKKLIVLIAPPGFGKTTLLADFISHTELPVAWGQITSLDLDPMHLARLISQTLSNRFRRLAGKIQLEPLGNAPPKALARTILEPIQNLIDETFVLTLDDIQLLNDSDPSLELLDTLLLESPPQMTILLAGRDLPEVSMARLVVDSEMTGIGMDALAFSEQEIHRLVALASPAPASEIDIQRLLDRTQGWPAGVLLSLKITDGDFDGVLSGRPMVYEYLGSVAFEGLDPETRDFLLGVVVLPVMTRENCNHLLEMEDSQRILTRLVRRGLFITVLDHSPRSYTFHPQFREFLLDMAGSEQPDRLRALRIRAAEYLEENDQPESAFQILAEAEAFQQAADLAERHAYELFSTGRSGALAIWADTLWEHGQIPPNLHLLLASALSDKGDFEFAFRHLMLAKETLKDKRKKVSRREAIQAANIEGWLAYRMGDYPHAVAALRLAEELLDKSVEVKARASLMRLKALTSAARHADPSDVLRQLKEALALLEPESPYRHMQALLLLDIQHIQADLGKLKDARVSGERALAYLLKLGSPGVLASCINDLAVIAHQEGRYLEALDLLQKAQQHAFHAANPITRAEIVFGQADIFCDMGLPWQAGELYSEGLAIANNKQDTRLMAYGFLGTSVLHRRWGNHDVALEWLARARDIQSHTQDPPVITIQSAALQIIEQPQLARDRLLEMLSDRTQTLPLTLRSTAWYHLGRAEIALAHPPAAIAAIEHALDECLHAGTLQPVAGELNADHEFLQFLTRVLSSHTMLPSIMRLIDSMQTIAQTLRVQGAKSEVVPLLELHALGGPEVYLNGERVAHLEPLPRQVLFFLADSGPVARDVMLEAIWPDVPEGRQLASLYTATHSLRKTLGDDLILIEGLTYQLNPELNIAYDVDQFRHAAAIAESALPGDPRRYFALTEAINVFRGPFLPDISANWSLVRRDELDRHLVALLGAQAESALAQGREERAVESLRRALQLSPLRDDLNMRYLELLGVLGRRDELSAHYRHYTQLLASELGLDPPPEAQSLYQRLIS